MKISVVVPTYKRPDCLRRLLKSIASQTRLPDEVIVVDDFSCLDEQYSEVISEFTLVLPSLKFTCLAENSGAPVARNKGIDLAEGDWIALVDDDDEWMPEKLNKQVALLEAQNDIQLGFVYTWAKALGQDGQESYDACISIQGDARRALLNTNFILSPSVLVSKEAFERVGGFDERLPSCQDWDTWINVALAGYHFATVEEQLVIYHRHGGKSIGLSPRAKLGYRLLLEKHWWHIIRYTSPLNWLKKLYLYSKVRVETYGQA